jgi:hypothetical protein
MDSTHALAFTLRFALLTDHLTFQDVPIFATRHALSENLAASVINKSFGAFNFYMGRGL